MKKTDVVRNYKISEHPKNFISFFGFSLSHSREFKMKKLIILFLASILIIASVFAYFQIKKSPLAELQKERETCIKSALQTCLQFTEEGSEAGEATFYYFGKAAMTDDPKWCDKMNESYSVKVCKAYLSKNTDYCNKSSRDYNDCVTMLSSKEDSPLCYDLKQIYQRGICLVLSTHDSSYCKPSSDEKCYAEYYGKAYLLTNDDKHCKKISDVNYQKCCLELKNLKTELDTENCTKSPVFYQCISELNPYTICGGLE